MGCSMPTSRSLSSLGHIQFCCMRSNRRPVRGARGDHGRVRSALGRRERSVSFRVGAALVSRLSAGVGSHSDEARPLRFPSAVPLAARKALGAHRKSCLCICGTYCCPKRRVIEEALSWLYTQVWKANDPPRSGPRRAAARYLIIGAGSTGPIRMARGIRGCGRRNCRCAMGPVWIRPSTRRHAMRPVLRVSCCSCPKVRRHPYLPIRALQAVLKSDWRDAAATLGRHARSAGCRSAGRRSPLDRSRSRLGRMPRDRRRTPGSLGRPRRSRSEGTRHTRCHRWSFIISSRETARIRSRSAATGALCCGSQQKALDDVDGYFPSAPRCRLSHYGRPWRHRPAFGQGDGRAAARDG